MFSRLAEKLFVMNRYDMIVVENGGVGVKVGGRVDNFKFGGVANILVTIWLP